LDVFVQHVKKNVEKSTSGQHEGQFVLPEKVMNDVKAKINKVRGELEKQNADLKKSKDDTVKLKLNKEEKDKPGFMQKKADEYTGIVNNMTRIESVQQFFTALEETLSLSFASIEAVPEKLNIKLDEIKTKYELVKFECTELGEGCIQFKLIKLPQDTNCEGNILNPTVEEHIQAFLASLKNNLGRNLAIAGALAVVISFGYWWHQRSSSKRFAEQQVPLEMGRN